MSSDEEMKSESGEEKSSDEEETQYEDNESDDSDKELQIAFQKGLLKDIVVEKEQVTTFYANNKEGLKEALSSMQRGLPWYETLHVAVEALVMPRGMERDMEPEEDLIKMENKCYRQTQSAVLKALPLLRKNGIRTKRPEDFFAEMVKSDEHMKKVKENILTLKAIKEKSEQAKKQRETRKFKKLADKEAKSLKRKERLENKEALQKSKKKFKLGQNDLKTTSKGGYADDDDDDDDDDVENKTPAKKAAPSKGMYNKEEKTTGKKRKFKNEKYGFGGQKKRSKSNTQDSLNDFDNKALINKKMPMKNKNKRVSRVKRKGK